jgi:hypothetical protein
MLKLVQFKNEKQGAVQTVTGGNGSISERKEVVGDDGD